MVLIRPNEILMLQAGQVNKRGKRGASTRRVRAIQRRRLIHTTSLHSEMSGRQFERGRGRGRGDESEAHRGRGGGRGSSQPQDGRGGRGGQGRGGRGGFGRGPGGPIEVEVFS